LLIRDGNPYTPVSARDNSLRWRRDDLGGHERGGVRGAHGYAGTRDLVGEVEGEQESPGMVYKNGSTQAGLIRPVIRKGVIG
jgi:hypothetical protein